MKSSEIEPSIFDDKKFFKPSVLQTTHSVVVPKCQLRRMRFVNTNYPDCKDMVFSQDLDTPSSIRTTSSNRMSMVSVSNTEMIDEVKTTVKENN